MRGKRGISTTLIAGIIVLIVVIAAIGVSYYYFWMPQGEPEEPEYPIETATNLQFKVDMTYEGMTDTYTYYLKDMGTDDFKLREDADVVGEHFVTVIDVGEESAWMYAYDTWMEMDFQENWAIYEEITSGYIDRLAEWTEGEETYTYTDPDIGEVTIKIYNIMVDPVLDDSLFDAEGHM
jgi:hypothetical protein